MGLFKGIGHFFKGILHGVKSAFKWVGKVLNSKLGRIIMIAAGVFTAGVALAAGIGAFAASSGGFLSSCVTGAHAFVTALAHPLLTSGAMMNGGVETAGTLASGGETALASNASALAGDSAAEAAPAAADAGAAATDTATAANAAAGGGAADSYGLATGTSPTTGAAAPVAGAPTGPGVAPAAATPTSGAGNGLLTQAQRAGGGITINMPKAGGGLAGPLLQGAGQLASGYAQGAAQEKIQEQQQQQENYYGNLWNPVMKYNGNVGGAGVIAAAGGAPSAPNPGYLSMAQNIAGFMNGKAGGNYGAPNVQPGAAPNVKSPTTAAPTTTGA